VGLIRSCHIEEEGLIHCILHHSLRHQRLCQYIEVGLIKEVGLILSCHIEEEGLIHIIAYNALQPSSSTPMSYALCIIGFNRRSGFNM
jgi:hypothetical protein